MPSTIDAIELQIRRRNVEAFIQAQKETIVLHRRPKAASANGGWTYGAETVLPAQDFRIQNFKRRIIQERVTHEVLGPVTIVDKVLVGRWNADIQERDWFELDGAQYEVKHVEKDNNDRTASVVVTRSED